MNFIKTYLDCLDDLEVKSISNIADFLSPNIECSPRAYYLKNILQKNVQSNNFLDYDEVLVKESGEIRNFNVFVYESNEGCIVFPLQDKTINIEIGLMLIFPTSFMYPYKHIISSGQITYIEMQYFFNKDTIRKKNSNAKLY